MSKHPSEQPQAVYPSMPEPPGWYPDEPTGSEKVQFLLDDGEPESLWWVDEQTEADTVRRLSEPEQMWEREKELAKRRGFVW